MEKKISNDGIINVNRVTNFKDESKVIFQTGDGMIMHIDKKDEGNDKLNDVLTTGDSAFLAITTVNEKYGFGIGTVNGMLIAEFITSIPVLKYQEFVSYIEISDKKYSSIRLLLNIISDNLSHSILVKIPIELENLKHIRDKFKEMVYCAGDIKHQKILDYINVLQYLYNTYYVVSNTVTENRIDDLATIINHNNRSTSHNGGDVETNDKITELEAVIVKLKSLGLHDQAESIENELKLLKNKGGESKVLDLLEVHKKYKCEYGVRGDILNIAVKMVDGDKVLEISGEIYGTYAILTSDIYDGCDDIDFDSIVEIYEIKSVYEKGL